MLDQSRVAVLGLGTLGRALAEGLVRSGDVAPERLTGTVRRAEHALALDRELPFAVGIDAAAAASAADVLLLCTKPKAILGLVTDLARAGALDHGPLIVSAAAGISTASIEAVAPDGARCVRAMPNTPCLIGEGMTVVSRGSHASAADAELARSLFAPLGRVLELDEEHMDAVTGLSGSGPAFVYVILEAFSEGGVMMGLPRAVATELAAQTVRGAASLVLETGKHPAALKDDVLTPAGCTIAGLLVMEDGGIRSTLARGIQEAARAAAGLGGERKR
ncbi:pyrroline-5-carboxylate reductase [Engelhardtia mirabilis]|uniref:Pyrroline-5-carboxylate reductase n=1 Tax=Engelhardtia mirabilis TaxID=2528011 RepID=A0A518BMU4_9BACT|nr:Pyrroline-5-carboxylate reductase [Planctomycetes bacterium Pla133]QDV02624.1 Pyrroline-5-carboxylate reductase [Planctomycetes bacterium Pla86]